MDLANALIQETWRKKTQLGGVSGRSPASIRSAVAHAKRLILDESMSSFLAELATVPFKVANERRPDVLDSLRHSARLPFPKMFIEIDGRSFRAGLLKQDALALDIDNKPLIQPDDDELLKTTGWLLEQDERDTELIWVTEFMDLDEVGVGSLPYRFAYRTDDKPFIAERFSVLGGMFAHGITPHICKQIAVVYANDVLSHDLPKEVRREVESDQLRFYVHHLVPEFGGVIRYVLAFLATFNNVPKIETHARPAKGFLGGGQIRKYMDHTTLTLSLPAKQSTTTFARRVIAAARKGWHEVRPHWRIYHKGNFFCKRRDDHMWMETDSTGHAGCHHCDARRVWIVLPTGRGDPTISLRTHNYRVTHYERA